MITAKSKCPRCFGGIEFPKSGIGYVVECPHCSRKIQLRLNPFAPASEPASATNMKIQVCKCEPAPTVMPQKESQKRAPGARLQKLTEETIRARTKTGDTPLHRAAKNGKIHEIPQHLLRMELFVLKNNEGQTPLDLAVRYGHFDKVPRKFLTKEIIPRVLHSLVICGYADQIPKEFLKPEYFRITNDGETVLHVLARLDRLDLVPEVYRDDEMWNVKSSLGETPRERQQHVLEWKNHRDAYVARVRAEPATEKQKDKLRFFGYGFDENITKGQASDALDKCVRDFPQANQAYYSRPATEEQLAKLREINMRCKPDELFYNFEEEGFPTYGQAKDSLQDWELYKREQVENSDLMDCMDTYWEKPHWDDDYEVSERGRFDHACCEILDGWQFEKFGDLPTRKQVAKTWKLVKSRKPNKAELPTHGEIIAALLEIRGGIGRSRG